MSISLQRVDAPILVVPPAAESLDEAHAAIELWEHYSRKRLDPSQRLVVEVLMAQDASGRWAAATTGREMPRQNGKGDEIEVVELWGLTQRSEAILHTVHDAVLLATQTQQRMLSVLEGHADLRRLVKRKWQGTGQQMIELRNGGTIWYRTRTAGGGRGVDDVDRLVVDEAQHATAEQLAAISPTLLANTNPQLNAMGTAGLARHSAWWWSVRRRALLPEPGAFGYVGHTAEVPTVEDGKVKQHSVDVQDRDLWRRANPSVAAGRGGGMAFLEEQLRRLGPDDFAREHLGVWDPDPDGAASGNGLDLSAWSSSVDDQAEAGSPMFAVVSSADASMSAVGVAWRRPDGRVQVQVADRRAGQSWVPMRLRDLKAAWPSAPVVVPPSSRVLAPDATHLKQSEVVEAYQAFSVALESDEIRHFGEAVLNTAVAGATWRVRESGRVLDGDPALLAVALAAAAIPRSVDMSTQIA